VDLPWKALDQLLPYVDRNALFRGRWGYVVHDRAEWTRLVEAELGPQLAALWQDAKAKRWLRPQGIYGYFPVQADGNHLIVYDPAEYSSLITHHSSLRASERPRELARFTFPRQQPDGTKRNEDQLCIADYFRPVESGEYDVAAFQVVTAGQVASEYADRLRAAGEYNRSLQVHGVSVQAAEAMADYVNDRVRQELGLVPDPRTGGGSGSPQAPLVQASGGNPDPKRGLRYSWGYLACPDLADQVKLFQMMPVADQIGVTITESFQFVPEQSTAAIVVHHPQAKYFSVIPAGGAADRATADTLAAGD
jgi:5-methyltetrahydrofolate--homocysteine methyltransferase